MNNATLMSKSDDKKLREVAALKIASEKTNYLDRLTDNFSDWCSPILVKETRQALKSRQFFWTFFLLLVAIAIWTMLGLTINDASVEFGNAGPNLFVGYLMILGFPLAIVIPFGAYRSLAREYEDGTIQLVSVTTMNAWQIVAGKLGSSMLQTLIYLSVIAPCIAFTYLLRGLSLPQISVGILVCVSGCFSLCCAALFFASATRSRIYGVGVSIVLILTQVATFIFWVVFTVALANGELALLAGEGMFITAGLVMAILSTGALAFAGAASMISFAADNRSSLVRAMMLLQQTLFIAWAVTLSCYLLEREMMLVWTFVTSHYWLIMGFVLIGEDEQMSERVKRSIPQSLFGRTFGSWFFPGSGRGLIFATINTWFCGLVFLLLQWVGYAWLPQAETTGNIFPTYRYTPAWSELASDVASVVSVCLYSSFFLAFTYFICKWYRSNQRAVFGLLSFVTGVVSVFIFTGGSLLVHFNLLSSRDWDQYTIEQLFNMYWTSTELLQGWDVVTEPMLLLFAALCLLSICLFAWMFAARELHQTRGLTPERVQKDRAEERKGEQLPKGESIDEIFAEPSEPTADID